MAARKWSDIRAQRFTPKELLQIDKEVESELEELESVRAEGEATGEWTGS